ncbi:Hpt domain-containing protein [Dongia rigui]|uniref:Hpt domain-containing protein n=1 Tax=Dongia rigui TaxID=940149 RepID=A0ABU5DZA0_9PROT|nr:Hpt domain-containing protein [Dongia rigui]MDY0871876.1 Hpt domain-containing protein [Dongia rigui]
MARRLARAEAAVADLAKSYVTWASADVDKCTEHLATARAVQPVANIPEGAVDDRMIAVQALYAIAHNIKGQGSSFGFPLMTRLGDSLCRLTRAKRPIPDADLNLIQAHLDAMRLVLAQNIRGDGGAIGDKLAQRLEAMVMEIVGPVPQPDADLIR